MAIKTLEEYKKEALNATNAQRQADKTATEQTYESQKKLVTDTYKKQIDETADSYEDLYRQNAVQKLINEREVAENMANLGLTDSGLNRTQQTAVQLSYANANAKYDISRQKAVDSLAAELANKISTLDTEKLSDIAGIDSNYDNAAFSAAQSMRNADIEAETARYKAEQEQIAATNKAYYAALSKQQETENNLFTYSGPDPENANNVIFYDSNGKKYSKEKGINPYTGDNNTKYGDGKKYGVFSNGYQPKGIGSYGKISWTGYTDNIYGREQKIWKTNDGTEWIWNGRMNRYLKYER